MCGAPREKKLNLEHHEFMTLKLKEETLLRSECMNKASESRRNSGGMTYVEDTTYISRVE